MFRDLILAGGTMHREATSVCKVSLWHIPNGADYEHARAYEVFFNDITAAERMADKYHNPPEMAILIAL